MGDANGADIESQAKHLKRRLEGVRAVVLHINSVLVWDEQWHPALIFGVVSAFYFFIWLIDPSILPLLAIFGILFNLIDFFLPTILKSVNLSNEKVWTGKNEKELEVICKALIEQYHQFRCIMASFYQTRNTSPRFYYAVSILGLSILAWFGATVDNVLLCWMASLLLAMWPGLQRLQFVKRLLNLIATKVGKVE